MLFCQAENIMETRPKYNWATRRRPRGAFHTLKRFSDGVVIASFVVLLLMLGGLLAIGSYGVITTQTEIAKLDAENAARREALRGFEHSAASASKPTMSDLKDTRLVWLVVLVAGTLWLVQYCYLFGIYAHARSAGDETLRLRGELSRLDESYDAVFAQIAAMVSQMQEDLHNSVLLLSSIESKSKPA